MSLLSSKDLSMQAGTDRPELALPVLQAGSRLKALYCFVL